MLPDPTMMMSAFDDAQWSRPSDATSKAGVVDHIHYPIDILVGIGCLFCEHAHASGSVSYTHLTLPTN